MAATAFTTFHHLDPHDITTTDDEACNSDDDADADLTQPVVAAAFSFVECNGFPVIG